MENAYEMKQATVIRIIDENKNTKTLCLKLERQEKFQFLAGQFMMIGVPGFGECPISISSNPRFSSKFFSLTIRAAGELTTKLIALKRNAKVLVRGPFGNGFPVVDKNLILIGGGCGFIPLRSVFEENRLRKDIKIQLFFGCRDVNSLVFQKELSKNKDRLHLIFEKEIIPGFASKTGFVTKLIKDNQLLTNAKVFICGPEVMYASVVKELLKKGILANDIYLSLEKRMHCGIGICQHCAVGPKYICKDGPVFSYEFLKNYYFYE